MVKTLKVEFTMIYTNLVVFLHITEMVTIVIPNSAYPAESAKIIKDLIGINTDGVYYIKRQWITQLTV
jgi:hypothetical protein